MKKISKNLIISGIITIGITIINYITALIIERPIFSINCGGGEMNYLLGIGVDLEVYYPEINVAEPITEIPPEIKFDFITFILFFILVFSILMLIRKIKMNKEA